MGLGNAEAMKDRMCSYHRGANGLSSGLSSREIIPSARTLETSSGGLDEFGVRTKTQIIGRLATTQVGVGEARSGTG